MHARRVVIDENGLLVRLGIVAFHEVDDSWPISLLVTPSSTARASADPRRYNNRWFCSCQSEDLHQATLARAGSDRSWFLGSTAPGTSGMPGIGVFLHGGAMVCSVGLLLMSGEAHLLHASRW